MPQIGWFEILIIVVLSILIIGPKDFPIMLKKIGGWVGTIKSYFNEVQSNFKDVERSVDEDINSENKYLTKENDKKKDDWW